MSSDARARARIGNGEPARGEACKQEVVSHTEDFSAGIDTKFVLYSQLVVGSTVTSIPTTGGCQS